MGQGASKVTPHPDSTSCYFFEPHEVKRTAKLLSTNVPIRKAFVQYVKGSTWLDLVGNLHFENLPTVNIRKIASVRDRMHSLSGYESIYEVIPPALKECHPKTTPSSPKEHTGRFSGIASKCTSTDSRDECYASLENICGMSEHQLVAVMTSILFPMFLDSLDYKGLVCGGTDGETQATMSVKEARPASKTIERVQAILLSCAARFDEDELLLQLQDPAWISALQSAFHDFPLPISVCDTNRDTCPLVYVNKAFEELVGRPSRKLLGKRLNVLNGPGTELVLFERVLEAQRCNLPCKVAITHYAARGGERFLDLLALRPSGGYSFAVHCPAHRSTLSDDVKMVDDALMLLAYVVKAPPVRKLQRGESWVPDMNSLRVLSRHLRL